MNININKKNLFIQSRGGLLTVLSCCIMLSGCAKTGNAMEIVWTEAEQQSDTMTESENTLNTIDYTIDTAENTDKALSAEAGLNIKEQTKKAQIYVYICGAVQNPGVYEVDFDSRLYNIVELAGGMTIEADTEYVNLARTISDGEQIVILTKEETADMEIEAYLEKQKNQSKEENVDGKVNINTASKTQLTAITGIGESRAQAIIEYRESSGVFNRIEDIKKVDGIKDGLFEKIKNCITVE